MTEFTKKKFSVAVGSESYRDNWERVFKAEPPAKTAPEQPLNIDLAHMRAELQKAVGMLMRVPHPRSVEVSNAENVLCLLLELLP